MREIKCPYCGEEQEINHDDGYGYEEDRLHEQECGDCDKTFTFTTSIHYYYEAHKADCLNGSPHKLKPTTTIPIEFTRMYCEECEYKRKPTEKEWKDILEAQQNGD